jgi:hypothetical protein
VRANLAVDVRVLADSDDELRIALDDLPVKPTDAEPPIIEPDPVLDRIADEVNHVHRIAAVIGLLNEDVEPQLVARNALISKRAPHRHRDRRSRLPGLTSQRHVPGCPHRVDVVLRYRVREWDSRPNKPEEIRSWLGFPRDAASLRSAFRRTGLYHVGSESLEPRHRPAP